MIVHYIKIAVRNLLKYKIQNLIGIIGMAIGISFFTIGYNWLKYETSYDGFYPDSKYIYRLYGIDKQTGNKNTFLPLILGDKLTQEFPEVKEVTMFYSQFSSQVKWGEMSLGYPDFKFVDEHFFKIFPPKIIAGRWERLLYTPEELVVTESFARKYWGTPEEAVGKVLEGGYGKLLTIIAVMQNSPANSNFEDEGYRPDIFDRERKSERAPDKIWHLMSNQIYVQLHKNMDINAFRNKLQEYTISNKYNENLIIKAVNVTGMRYTLGTDMSFNINYIRTFMGAGLLLLLCSLFNFLNLFINRMLQRNREIKLRKTVGGSNYSIIKLLQTELCLQLLLTFVVGFLLLIWAAPLFEKRFETHIAISDLLLEYILFSIITYLVMFIFCLLSEARYIRFRVLTQSFTGTGRKAFRNISICIQLSICVFFLMSSFVFYRQVSFMGSFDWGFKKEGLIKLTMDANYREPIMKDVLKLPIIDTYIPTGLFDIQKEPYFRDGTVDWEGKSPDTKHPILIFDVDSNFFEGFEIPIIEGRNFKESDFSSKDVEWGKLISVNKVIISKSLANLLGKENLIGQTLKIPDGSIHFNGTIGTEEMEIIGVVKDFHVASLQNPVYPVVFMCMTQKWDGYYNYVRVREGKEQEAIVAMKEIFKKHYSTGDPEDPQIESLSQLLDDMNKTEHASLQLFSVLATLCIVIAIFGIYSISSSNMERRKKEIAIRKVSGASGKEIARMFLFEYLKMLLIANVIALPLAFYFMHEWLMQYAYKIRIEFWMFLLVFLVLLIIVFLTVLSQVINAVRSNPADVLKSE